MSKGDYADLSRALLDEIARLMTMLKRIDRARRKARR